MGSWQRTCGSSGRLFGLALIVFAAPCGGQVESRPAPVKVPRDPGPVDLGAIAREVDPGEVTPLRQQAPAWLVRRLDQWTAPFPKRKQEALHDELKSLLHRLENLVKKQNTEQSDLAPLAAPLWRLDGAARQEDVTPDILATAGQFYLAAYRITSVAERLRQVAPSKPFFYAGLGREALSSAQVQELRAFDGKLRAHFWRMTRKIGARILRSGKPKAQLPRVLSDLSSLLSEAELFEPALGYQELAVARAAQPKAADWITLGERYAANYLVAEARAALSKAQAADSDLPPHELKPQLQRLAGAIDAAGRVLELQDPTSMEERLERARHLETLGHVREATTALTALQEARPKDARPLAALARMALGRFAVRTASALLKRAEGLEHHDATYYEAKLILTPIEFAVRHHAAMEQGDLRPVAEMLRDQTLPLVQKLKSLGRQGMDVFELGVVTTMEGILTFLDASQPEARAWRTKTATVIGGLGNRWPDRPDVRRFAIAATLFREDLAAARRDLQKPLPAEQVDPDLAIQRVEAYLATVEDPAADDFRSGLDIVLRDLPEGCFLRPLALGTWHALLARERSHRTEWRRAEQYFREALESAPEQDRALLWNNLGVTLAEQGQANAARRAFVNAEKSAGEKKHLPVMNRLVTGPSPGPAKLLKTLLAPEDLEPCELAWVVHLARKLRRDTTVRVRSRELLHQIQDVQVLAHLEFGHLGVVSGGTFAWGMRYNQEGPRFRCEFDVRLWLIRPAPISLAEIQKLAKGE